MAAELKIIVTGAEAALKQLAAVEQAYERLAQRAILLQKQASSSRVSEARREAAEIKRAYAGIGDPLGGGGGFRRSGGGSGSVGGGGGAGGGAGGITSGGMVAAGLAVGALTKALDLAVDGLKAFAGFLVSDVVKPQMQLERFATQLENSTRGQVKSAVVMDKANALQLRWNIDANAAAEAMGSLQDKTGRVELSMGAMDDLGQLSKAYGIELKDLVDYTGAIANLDPSMAVADVLGVIKQSLAGGMEEGGKFTLKEIARTGGAMFTSAAAMSGTGQERAAKIGAFVQATGTTGKLDESITNANAFISKIQDLVSTKKLSGSEVLSKDTKQVDLDAALEAVLAKTVTSNAGGKKTADATKLAGLGLGESAGKAINPLFDVFAKALEDNGGDVKAASAAALSGYRRISQAAIDEAEIKAAAAKTMATSAEKWDSAVNKIKDKLLAVMPAVQSLIDQLAEVDIADTLLTLADVLLDVLQWLADKFSSLETRMKVGDLRRRREQGAAIDRAAAAGDGEEAARLKAKFVRDDEVAAEKAKAIKALASGKQTGTFYESLSLGELKYRPARTGEQEIVNERLAKMVQRVQTSGSVANAQAYITENVKTGMITQEQADVLTAAASKSVAAMDKYDAAVDAASKAMDKAAEAARDMALGFDKIPTGPVGGGGNGGKK